MSSGGKITKNIAWLMFDQVLCMYGLGAPKGIIKYTWSIVSVVWSIVAVVMTYKGFRKLELLVNSLPEIFLLENI